MEKYCPNCNKMYGVTDKNFCTLCGEKLEIVANQKMNSPEDFSKEISVIKNKIVWNIPVGEIAYRISEKEMETLLNATGIVVDEGVTAYIYIDGRVAAEIHGGTYDFVSNEELQRKLNARFGGMADKLKNVWKVITRFWVGTSTQERINQQNNVANASSIDEVVASIRKDASYSVILKVDKEFPLVFETTINTSQYNGKVGIGIAARITNFQQFIQQFFVSGSRHNVSNIDVRDILYGTVEDCLRSESFPGGQVSDDVRSRLLNRLQARMTELSLGIDIVRVTDCTINSEDMNRLRALDREIYLSEAELDRLHKINIIKNRLSNEEAQQQIEAARGELGIIQVMNEINRDNLLAEDEMQAFVETLANARRLRTAQNQEDYDAAIQGIRQAQILRETDIQLLVAESNERLYQRSTAFSLLQLQDTIHRNKIEQAAGHEMQQAEMQHQIGLTRIKDAYQDERFLKQLEQENLRFKSSLQKRREIHDQDVVEMEDNIRMLDGLRELDEKKRQADHNRQMEIINNQHAHRLEEEKEKHTHEKNVLEIKSRMTAEQLTGEQLSKLPQEALVAYFNNGNKEIAALARAEAERRIAEFIDKRSSEMTYMMADLLRKALDAAGGSAESERQRAEEYRADLHREQDRYDRQQEQVTRYTIGGNKAPSSQPSAPTVPPAQPQQPAPPFIAVPQHPTGGQNVGRKVKCPKCGKENDLDEGSFCAYCREPLQ